MNNTNNSNNSNTNNNKHNVPNFLYKVHEHKIINTDLITEHSASIPVTLIQTRNNFLTHSITSIAWTEHCVAYHHVGDMTMPKTLNNDVKRLVKENERLCALNKVAVERTVMMERMNKEVKGKESLVMFMKLIRIRLKWSSDWRKVWMDWNMRWMWGEGEVDTR